MTHYRYPDVTVFAEGSADGAPGFPFTMAYTAVFELGTLQYSTRLNPTLRLYRADGQTVTPTLPDPLGSSRSGLNISTQGPYAIEQRAFLDCVRSGTPPSVVTAEMGREAVSLARLEMESVRKGAPVALP